MATMGRAMVITTVTLRRIKVTVPPIMADMPPSIMGRGTGVWCARRSRIMGLDTIAATAMAIDRKARR
jgi:hypothetical protein